jgi:hypothetical protein
MGKLLANLIQAADNFSCEKDSLRSFCSTVFVSTVCETTLLIEILVGTANFGADGEKAGFCSATVFSTVGTFSTTGVVG